MEFVRPLARPGGVRSYSIWIMPSGIGSLPILVSRSKSSPLRNRCAEIRAAPHS